MRWSESAEPRIIPDASDAEPLPELLRDLAELDLGEALEVRHGTVLREVLLPVDVRDHRGHGLLGEDELQRGLGEAHPLPLVDPAQVRRLFPRSLDPRRILHLEIPVRGEVHRVRARLEDASGVRRADHHPLIDLERDREELAARLLLEEIVIRLDATEIALPHRRPPFLEAAGARAEGDPAVAGLPLRLQRL